MALTKITWADKTALNPQPSVARENKCTDDDLNEIKSVVNTNVDNVGDITDLDTTDKSSVVNGINELYGNYEYSTTETLTNKVFVDGKPIYRKLYYLSSLPNTSETSINIDIANLGWVVELYGSARNNNDYYNAFPLNVSRPDSATNTIGVWLGRDGNTPVIKVRTGGDRTNMEAYIILEYTKTS